MIVQSVYRAVGIVVVLTALFVAVPVGIRGEVPKLWGSLQAGEYAVGFRTLEAYDSSRTFGPKKDYFGNPAGGEHTRPIQAMIWYPAAPDADGVPMTVSEYVTPSPVNNALYQHITAMSRIYVGALFRAMGNAGGRVLDANNLPVMAVRDADPAEDRFPLLVYFANPANGYLDNFVLCEYLASHGFVVMATHAYGASTYAIMQREQVHLEAITRDMEYCLPMVRRLPYVAADNLGVIGVAGGAQTAWILQMRNYDVEVLVTLDGTHLMEGLAPLLMASGFFDPTRAVVPSLQIRQEGIREPDYRSLDSCRYGDRTLVTMGDSASPIFTCYGGLLRILQDTLGTEANPLSAHYRLMIRYVHSFLETHLNDNPQNTDWFTETGPWPESVAEVTVRPAEEIPPTPEQFMAIINAYGMDRAVEVYERFRQSAPGSITFPEANMNAVAYNFLQGGRVNEALEAFRMNTETYPLSPNVWDSYADGLTAVGDTARALDCYRQVLQLLPQDTVTAAGLRETLRANAERALGNLTQ